MVTKAEGPGWVLYLGRWQDTPLADARGATVLTDPPYTRRNILGYRSGSDVDLSGKKGQWSIPYAEIGEDDARELSQWAASAAAWWYVAFNDHIGWHWLEQGATDAGLLTFAPVIWSKTNPPPRLRGDGPGSACEHLMVSRQRGQLPAARSGHRPGHYHGPGQNTQSSDKIVIGQKPLWLMQALVRDYSQRGDVILEPYAGSGTTLLAAETEGREAIGAEADPDRFEKAAVRLSCGFTKSFDFGGAA